MTPSLVQILPPLSQSKVETAACPRSYVAVNIEGRRTGESVASDRGTEVHAMMAEYIMWCVRKQVASDWIAFNQIARAAGADAGGILDGLRDSYEVHWDLVYGCEVTMMLDEDFRPTLEISDEHWPKHIKTRNFIEPVNYEGGYVAHIGTADQILISADGLRGKIEDFKSHMSPFDPDTYQDVLYSFMLLKHMPQLNQVTFELRFVRYENCVRSVTWKRSDMPEMQQIIARARERQRATHENPDAAKAIPCKQCSYCPLGVLTLDCPIRELNPMISMDLQSRLLFKEWSRRMNADNTPILKAHAEVRGSISYTDGNGRVYEFGKLDTPSTTYPLDRTMLFLMEQHKSATGEDSLDGRFNISSTKLKAFLKAKKRALLKEQVEDSVAQTETKPKWGVRTPEGIETEFNPYEQD